MAQKFNPPFGSGGKTVSKPMAKSPEQQMGQSVEPMEEDGSQVAAQHGPANMVNIEHEHEMGSHHVSSMHQDGHEHHSDHPTAEAAHEHAKKLAGVGQEQEHDEEGESEPWGKE